MIDATKGNTLLVTLLMTSLLSLLILSMLRQVHLENKLLNQIRNRQVLSNAAESMLNDMVKKINTLPMNGQLTVSGIDFNYQIRELGEKPCLIIHFENKVFQSYHYQITLHYKFEQTFLARIAMPSDCKIQCPSKQIQIPKGIQYILHEA